MKMIPDIVSKKLRLMKYKRARQNIAIQYRQNLMILNRMSELKSEQRKLIRAFDAINAEIGDEEVQSVDDDDPSERILRIIMERSQPLLD